VSPNLLLVAIIIPLYLVGITAVIALLSLRRMRQQEAAPSLRYSVAQSRPFNAITERVVVGD
jgi:hypothetical protein